MADTKFSALPSVSAGATDVVPVVQGGTPSRTTPLSIGKLVLLNPTALKAFADSPVSAAAGDLVTCDTTNGNITVNLPTAPADKTLVCVKHITRGGTNTITINTGGTDVINKAAGATSYTLTVTGQDVIFQYQASTGIWYVIADDISLTQLDARYFQISNNLSEGTAATMRTSLGLGTVATKAATSGTSILKGDNAGGFANATSGTDYAPATSGSAILKGNGSGGFSSATSGTDYAPATSGSGILKGNGSGGFSTATADTDYTTPTGTETLTNKRVTKRVSALSAGSATPAINTDTTDVVHITAQSAAITSFTTNLTGTPVDGDTLRISITDNGTARALTWGTSFEASTVALPTTTVISTRLDVGFFWNTETSKWRCVAVA